MDESDDGHYTSGEGAPASYIPKPVQFVVATACTALVVFVLVIACCLAKSQCAWHEPLVRVAKQIEGTERRRRRAEERQRRRALRETEVSPLQRAPSRRSPPVSLQLSRCSGARPTCKCGRA